MEELRKSGAEVSYYDPFVPEYHHHGCTYASIPALSAEAIASADLVMVTTSHTNVDYALVQRHAKMVFDTKNAMKQLTSRENIELL